MALTHTILVVGGAGYIGSHMVKTLLGEGYRVVTLDNLSTGYRDAVVGGEFIEADLADRGQLEQLFSGETIDAVMHFASFIQVGESVQEPAKYYANNVTNTLNLLDAMVSHGVKQFHLLLQRCCIWGANQDTHRRRPPKAAAQSLRTHQIDGGANPGGL